MNIVTPTNEQWDELIARSHQTSLYVTRPWLDHFADRLLIAGIERFGRLTCGVVAQRTPELIPFFAYAGILQTRKEQWREVEALLEFLERETPGCVVTNAPSLVDIAPFKWRPQPWADDIRYLHHRRRRQTLRTL